MSWTTWLQLAGICLLGAMAPGPSLTMVLQQTVNGGRLQGMVATLAHSMGVGLYAFAAAQGLALVLTTQPWLFRLLSWAGAAYLFWLGWQSLRSAGSLPQASSDADSAPGARSLLGAARVGLLVSLSNPHLAVFFIALLSQFISPHMPWSSQLLLVATAVSLDVGWYGLLVLLISQPWVLQTLRSKARWIDRCGGVLLMLLGLRTLLA